MELIGYLGAILMGLSLGLIGGGGSILTVPILVYLFKIDAVLATAYSLFIVGLVSLIGSFSHIRQGNVEIRTAIVFGIPSIITVFLTRFYLVPLIPAKIISLGSLEITKPIALLLLFAVIMLMASYSMIKKQKPKETKGGIRFNYPMILLEGAVVGVVTGLVGAGGGFLIIPALVLLANLPMKQAVGTSLIIIATKSLIGFVGDIGADIKIDWLFLAVFSGIAVGGILLGSYLSKFVSNDKLKPAFGWFVLVMGVYILSKELLFRS
jgi:uncharacterized membrane protein YfcA